MRQGRFSKVIGIGLPKTGTTTLGAMLRRLGHHHAPYDLSLIDSVARGERSALWDRIERFDSFEDWPWPAVFEEIHAAVPDAAFVLTVRKDAQTWLRSVEKHKNLKSRGEPLNRDSPASRVERMLLGDLDFGTDPGAYLLAYEGYRRRVRTFFKDDPSRFVELCWETGDGWPELCGFLGHPVIEEALPHENSHQSMANRHGGLGLRRRIKRLARGVGILKPVS